MKKDKEWLKESLDKLTTGFNGRELSRYEMGRLDGYTHASMLFDQLDEPEKVVIPQFVAEWIESYRKKTLAELINDAVYSSDEDSKCFRRWFHEEMGFESNYSEFISRAWLDGYEVDTKKVRIKDVTLFESINMVSLTLDNGDHFILAKKEFNRITLSVDHETVLSKKGFTYLPTYIGNEHNVPVFDGFQIIKLP